MLWVSTLLTVRYAPWPPATDLFCNWQKVNGSLRKFLAKGFRKSEVSFQACSQLTESGKALDWEPGDPSSSPRPPVTIAHHGCVQRSWCVPCTWALHSRHLCGHSGRAEPSSHGHKGVLALARAGKQLGDSNPGADPTGITRPCHQAPDPLWLSLGIPSILQTLKLLLKPCVCLGHQSQLVPPRPLIEKYPHCAADGPG